MKKTIASIMLALFLGETAMAEEALSQKQQIITEVAAFAALGNQEGLKKALINGLDNAITINEFMPTSMLMATMTCGAISGRFWFTSLPAFPSIRCISSWGHMPGGISGLWREATRLIRPNGCLPSL